MIQSLVTLTTLGTSPVVDTFAYLVPDQYVQLNPYGLSESVDYISTKGLSNSDNDPIKQSSPSQSNRILVQSKENSLNARFRNDSFVLYITYYDAKKQTNSVQRVQNTALKQIQRTAALQWKHFDDRTTVPESMLYHGLDLAEIATYNTRSAEPPSPTLLDCEKRWTVTADIPRGQLIIQAPKLDFTSERQANTATIERLSGRMIAYALGEHPVSDHNLKFGKVTIPGHRFAYYPHRMANWSKFAQEHKVSWRYIPETAELHITGKTPIRLNLGSRTFYVGNRSWIALAPVTIHNKEIYIEENAMTTILEVI